MLEEDETDIDIEIVIEKLSRAERIQRDDAARSRRKEVKEALNLHTFKEEKEARDRLQAKRRMAKLQRQKMKKMQNNP
jgi:hypothetical protein